MLANTINLLLHFSFVTITSFSLAASFSLPYPSFPPSVDADFIKSGESYIVTDALQVTRDVRGKPITNLSGRILHKNKFRLWKKGKIASFNSTFVLNITPQPDGGGEGLAFILAKSFDVPYNSDGQWLGIVNASTNGSSGNNIVAVEFDTKKSFAQDLDDNHVGINVNTVYSMSSVSLNSSNITIATGNDITAVVLYDGIAKKMSVSVHKGNQTGAEGILVLSLPIDLSQYLPMNVYVGFSASTGAGSELNCVRSWYFNGTDIGLRKKTRLKIVIGVVIGALVLLLVTGFCLWKVKKTKVRPPISGDDPTISGIETGLGPKKFKLKDLKAATGNFNSKNELGRGGFGIVYKGRWEGNEFAVKRIVNTPQGKQNLIAEVTTIGSLHHKNLVKLIGWCYESDELLLVYEYMPNGSLDKLIYVDQGKEKLSILSWERRHGIICGVAQALDYLHIECSKRVLHRDIKASNIMLDADFNPCLGDFGLARMFKLSEKTHHSTKEIAGTPGYMAPEIFHTGRTTAETDVFAFGVLTLVVTCGQRAAVQNEESEYNESIVDWVWDLYKLDIVLDAVDPKLEGNFDKAQAECMLVLGLACCHPNPTYRPSMRNALQILMGEADPPPVPSEKPVFMWPIPSPSFTRDESSGGDMLTTFTSLSPR